MCFILVFLHLLKVMLLTIVIPEVILQVVFVLCHKDALGTEQQLLRLDVPCRRRNEIHC